MLLVRALEDGDPEELEGTVRRPGITNPQPNHVEALWVVLRQGAVLRVAEREHPARYPAAAVRREADRLWRERETRDSPLWWLRNAWTFCGSTRRWAKTSDRWPISCSPSRS